MSLIHALDVFQYQIKAGVKVWALALTYILSPFVSLILSNLLNPYLWMYLRQSILLHWFVWTEERRKKPPHINTMSGKVLHLNRKITPKGGFVGEVFLLTNISKSSRSALTTLRKQDPRMKHKKQIWGW